MGDLTSATVVRANRRQMSADLDGETVVLNFEDGVYYSLNPVGARIWELIQEPRSVGELLRLLLEEFDVEPGRCEEDLMALLGELSKHSLLEVSDGVDA